MIPIYLQNKNYETILKYIKNKIIYLKNQNK